VRYQAAFQALQFSFKMPSDEYARLWGMMRDLNVTGVKRPTWLGLELANLAIRGDMVTTVQSGKNPVWTQQPINGIVKPIAVPYVQSFAWRNKGELGEQYALMLFNLHLTETQDVVLEMPAFSLNDVSATAVLHSIESGSIHNNNEAGQQINIRSHSLPNFRQGYPLRLAPHSVHVVVISFSGNAGNLPELLSPAGTPPPAVTPFPTPVSVEEGGKGEMPALESVDLNQTVLVLVGILLALGLGLIWWRRR
jgi:LPXTG-motif cell wall-anchored protein